MNIKLNKILIFFVVFIALLSVSFNQSFIRKMEHQNLIGNNYYSENSIKLNKDTTNIEILEKLNKYTNYSIHGEIDNTYRYIMVSGKIDTPVIQTGRFINKGDLKDDVCVIGSEINKEIDDYIEYNLKKYKVIGIIDKEEIRLSNSVIFSGSLEEILDCSQIKIDVYNQKELYNELVANYQIETNEHIYFGNNIMIKIINIIVILIFFVSIMVISTYYVNSKLYEIRLKKVFGYTKIKIFFDLLPTYYLMILIAYLLSVIVTSNIISVWYLLTIIVIINISLYIPVSITEKKLRRRLYESNS